MGTPATSRSTDPRTRPRVFVLGSRAKPQVLAAAEALRPLLERWTEIVVWDFEGQADLAPHEADLVIVLGGDGSILRAVHQMGARQRPVVGVNLGKLGFLADLSPDEFHEALPSICAGSYRRAEHLMLACALWRDGQEVWTELVLNEVAVLSGPPFAMLDTHLYVDAELATTYSSDGLILATPVGSTAHSLSAGGPILRKELQAVVIQPISAHTLSNRPVVDSADRIYELVVPRPNAGTTLVIDGRMRTTLGAGDRLRVVRAEPKFVLVEVPGRGGYRTLREKLGWGGSLPPARE